MVYSRILKRMILAHSLSLNKIKLAILAIVLTKHMKKDNWFSRVLLNKDLFVISVYGTSL